MRGTKGKDKNKPREQLIRELVEIRQRITEMETLETERKQVEKSLRESEEKYRKLYELCPIGITTINKKGVITACNAAVYREGGYTEDEIVGKHFSKIAPVRLNDIPKFVKILAHIIRGKVPQPFEVTYNRKDGTTGWTEINIAPIKIGGKILGAQVLQRDITERKQAEATEKQLQQELQIASRLATVGEMAAGIAHEINNPLTGVIGFAQLLMKKDIPDDVRGDVHIIYEGAHRVASITSNLLTFARQYKGKRESTDINDIIKTTLAMRAYEMESSNIKVTTELDPDLPRTIADAGQLQQVFLNIILNAETEMITAHGGGNLLVKTERIDDAIRVSIKDDGPGIARKNLEKIFDPFFTTRDVGKGAGLGLSVCHGIVTGHGGKIYAESKFGKGATFIVELPIVTKVKQLKLAEPAAELKRISGARILVVDDDTIVQQFLAEILSEEEHEVEIIENGDDALERLKSEDYDVILLDVKLPGVSGIEIYKHLQKKAKPLARRVIFITGDVMGKETMAFLSRTRAPYITKPFDTEQLKKEIRLILSEST
jgi:PAS domain S-box-containing protein